MRDSYSRQISYLRFSLTDKCNLKCGYCWTSASDDESIVRTSAVRFGYDERLMSVRAASRVGITKVRITGGVPLCYPRLMDFIRGVKGISGIDGVYLTTNGTMLDGAAGELAKVGLDGINISLDTLKRDKYEKLTGYDMFDRAMGGLHAALSSGFRRIKLNVVLIGGFNDDEIPGFVALTKEMPVDVRFIELMPMSGNGMFGKNAFLSGKKVLKECPDLKFIGRENPSSVACLYALDGAKGKVGLIEPVFSSFCDKCNRLRITYDGFVKPCLHSAEEFSLVGQNETEMEATIRRAIESKPREHDDLRCVDSAGADGATTGGRSMKRIGG